MEKILCSATILTLNNEKTIKKCLESVSFCDDIVVLDGNSTDATREIANQCGARVYDQVEGGGSHHQIMNFTEMREKSFGLAKHDWVLYIDSDEYLNEELQSAIKKMVVDNDIKKVGMFERRALVEGKEIEYAYYYPDYSTRLINKTSGVVWKKGNVVHERLLIPQDVEPQRLSGYLCSGWPSIKECYQKDAHYRALATKKFVESVEGKRWFPFLFGVIKNSLRAVKVLLLALYLPIRHPQSRVLPFNYHWRFVAYNWRHAWSFEKWGAMLKKTWHAFPRVLRLLIIAGLIGRLLVMASVWMLQGHNAFVYSVNGDAVEYVMIAKNLVEHSVFSDALTAPFSPQGWRVPGLPLLLVVLGGGKGWFFPLIFVQLVATTALIPMVWRFTQKIFGEWTAMMTAGLVALEPNMLYWPSQVLTEPLFMVLFFMGVMMLVQWMDHPAGKGFPYAMILFAGATLTRQVSFFLLFIFPLMALVWLLFRMKVRAEFLRGCVSVSVGMVCAVMLVLPWYARNYFAFGDFTFGKQFAGKGSIGKYLESYTLDKYGALPLDYFPELVDKDHETQQRILADLTKKTVLRDPLPFVRIGLLSGIPFFASDGWFTMVKTINPDFVLGSFDKTWTGSFDDLWEFVGSYMRTDGALFLLAKVLYAAIALFGVFGAVIALYASNGVKRDIILLLLMIIAYAWIASGLGSYARFRYPFEPFIFMFAAVGMQYINNFLSQRKSFFHKKSA